MVLSYNMHEWMNNKKETIVEKQQTTMKQLEVTYIQSIKCIKLYSSRVFSLERALSILKISRSLTLLLTDSYLSFQY